MQLSQFRAIVTSLKQEAMGAAMAVRRITDPLELLDEEVADRRNKMLTVFVAVVCHRSIMLHIRYTLPVGFVVALCVSLVPLQVF
jgi:hypothetical protein